MYGTGRILLFYDNVHAMKRFRVDGDAQGIGVRPGGTQKGAPRVYPHLCGVGETDVRRRMEPAAGGAYSFGRPIHENKD